MKRITAIISLLLISTAALAQEKFSVTPQVGVQVGNWITNYKEDRALSRGLRFGAYGEYRFYQSRFFSTGIQAGLYGVKRGTTIDYSDPYAPVYGGYGVQVNGSFVATLHMSNTIWMFAKAGPYYGYLVKEQAYHISDAIRSPEAPDPFFCPHDYGIGFELGFGLSKFVGSFGMDIGLYDTFIDRPADKYDMSNFALFFTLGYRIDL